MFNAQIIIAGLVASIVLSVSAFVGGVKYEKGVVARRDLAAQIDQSKALVRAIDNRDAQRLKDEGIARKVSKDHASELEAIRAEYERSRTGGLRITADACRAITPASAQASSAGRTDAAPSATIALPAAVEQRLRELARDADESNAIARGLQEWARANGFYGP